MPRRFERHKRGTQYWDAQPARSDEVRQAAAADPEPVKRPPGRKDTRTFCKGKRGVEHVLSLVLAHDYFTGGGKVCEWSPGIFSSHDGTFPVKWACRHREICQRCGKVLRESWQLARDECPAYPGSEEQRAGAVAEAAAMNERYQAWSQRAKPVVTGRQSYRRRREG
jgi:hypothetical protein